MNPDKSVRESVSQSGDIDSLVASPLRKSAAWSVHLLTASGVVFCLLALEATYSSQWRTALFWLLMAVIVDSIDGTFARLVQVKNVLPNFDGALLDNVIDFLSFVIVPALMIHHARLLPSEYSFWLVSAICLASCYQFCQADAKTDDHYFRGFPSYWNILALYLLAMGLSPIANAAIVVWLVIMVFVPIKYLYVTRTPVFRKVTWPLTIVWAAMAVTILWQLPSPDPVLVWSSMVYFAYYLAASMLITLRKQIA